MVTSASNWSICVITLQFRFATKLSSSERQAYNIPVRYAADPAAAAKVTDSPPQLSHTLARTVGCSAQTSMLTAMSGAATVSYLTCSRTDWRQSLS